MDHAVIHRTEQASPELLGHTLDILLAPIDATAPAGSSLRGSGVYQAITKARRFDDTTLPMGAWEHEIKYADWNKVKQLAADALAYQSKDLQLAAWLLEAQIQLHGFAGVAATLRLLQRLCEDYWEELYPPATGGELDHRANVFRWINDKLPPLLRQVALAPGPEKASFNLADWERARRHEALGKEAEGAGPAQLAAALGATPNEVYCAMERELGDALAVLAELNRTVSARFGDQAPGLATFASVLEQARALLDAELHRRGLRRPAPSPAPELPGPAPASVPGAHAAPFAADQLGSRAQAYARLDEVANFLLLLEPHSPVPYLLRRASEWGRLNTAELYQELFLRLDGQINIFQLLGLSAPEPSEE